MKAYIDHVCYQVKDLDWYVSFFQDAFGMSVERTKTEEDGTRQVWMVGGLQFRENTDFDGTECRNHHVCLLVDDLEGSRARALELGCSEMPKHHWVKLPDGLKIEMFRAIPEALETMIQLPKKQ